MDVQWLVTPLDVFVPFISERFPFLLRFETF